METLWHWVLKLSLWPRVAIGISLGFLALTITFWLLSESILQESTDLLMNEQLGFAQLAASQLDSALGQAVFDLDQARQFADFDPADPDVSAEAHMLNHTLSRLGSFSSAIFFLDETGHLILAAPSGVLPAGADLSDLPYVSQAIQSRTLVISDPFQNPDNQRPVSAILSPLLKNGKVIGFLGGWIELDGQAFQSTLQETASFALSGHAMLLDSQGRVIVSSDHAAFLSLGEHVDFYQKVVQLGQPVVEVVKVDSELARQGNGEDHVMAVAPMQMAPWLVAVGVDAVEIFAGVRRLRQGMMALGSLALISIWGLTLVGTRALVRPVQQLTLAAQRIAEGKLDTPLNAPQGGEISALAESLEHMRVRLLRHIEELNHSKELLEVRVQERTKALRTQQTLTQQLLRRSIQAQEEERARISRELHDETGQLLTALQLNLDRLSRVLPEEDDWAHQHLGRVQELNEQALSSLRRIISDLRPGILDQLGLVPALKWIAENTLSPLGVEISVEEKGLQERFSGEIETILFRITQEAVSNVARHSQARSFCIRLERQEEAVWMKLKDDGLGFNPLQVASDPEFRRGLGLAGMQERASLAGGRITIESAPRRGTTVHVEIPLASPTVEE